MNVSGGPLMTQTVDGHWQIVGITSYGKGCGRSNELGVYTRVSVYLNWINMTIENLEKFKENRLQSFDKFDHTFLNSANISQTYFFVIFSYLFSIRMDKIFFYF